MIAVDAVVVVAMAEEAAPFLERSDAVGPLLAVGHAEQRLLSFGDRTVVLVRGGIGLVASATAAAVVLQATASRAIISAGSAGGVAAGVHVGDVVVGDEYAYTGADARAFGYQLGQVPGMPPVFAADAGLLAAVERVRVAHTVRRGTMLSGDAFIDASLVDGVRTAFPHGLSTDMESTALAQAAHLYARPFVSVRGISDLCGPAGADDFLTHVDDAADRSADVVLGLLRELGDAG